MLDEYDIDKYTACCFTGHRSRDLPFGGDRNTLGMKNLVSSIYLELEKAVRDGYKTFLSGMADGIDIICAEAVMSLKTRKNFDIRLVCVMPYPKQARKEYKNPRERYIYNTLIHFADKVIVVSPERSKGCYKLRNQFMVDHSSRLIGVYKEKIKGSGTLQTINMAKREGLEMKIIELDKNPVYYLEG